MVMLLMMQGRMGDDMSGRFPLSALEVKLK
jgi:hypothetical protein